MGRAEYVGLCSNRDIISYRNIAEQMAFAPNDRITAYFHTCVKQAPHVNKGLLAYFKPEDVTQVRDPQCVARKSCDPVVVKIEEERFTNQHKT